MRRSKRRAGRATILAVALLGAGAVALGVGGLGSASAAPALPKLALGKQAVNYVEGSSGTGTVTLTVTLSAPSTSTVTVAYATADIAAKVADSDYVAKTGTLSFSPGATSRSLTVSIRGDTKLETYENFAVKLSNPVNATISRPKQTVIIQNDELPKVALNAVKVVEGQTAVFKVSPAQKYVQPITLTVKTANQTAVAPGDYGAVTRTVSFPAGSAKKVSVNVTTVSDSLLEGNEKFKVQATATNVLDSVEKIGTISDAPNCPAGTPQTTPPPAAPASPSTPPAAAPPAAVTGGTAWDVMWRDEFDSASYTAANWVTGTNSGSVTLESNGELEWYVPGNSVVTTDHDGTSSVSVLQQRLTAAPVSGQYYTVRTLSRMYPPSLCPGLYRPGQLAPMDRTLVPYQFRSGMLNSAQAFGFRYGYVEARVKLSKGFALWPALWLRNYQPWRYEIDVLEGFDRHSRVLRSTYWWPTDQHFGTNNNGGDLGLLAAGGTCRSMVPVPATATGAKCSLANSVDLSAGYHRVGLHWTATKYDVYIDGVKRWSSKAGAVIDQEYNHVVINLALGSNTGHFDWTKEPMRPLDPDVLEGAAFPKRTIEWDYVRVWQAPGQHDVCTTGNC